MSPPPPDVVYYLIVANAHGSPNKLLRSFPALNADQIKSVTLTIIQKLPEDVYAEIINHAQ